MSTPENSSLNQTTDTPHPVTVLAELAGRVSCRPAPVPLHHNTDRAALAAEVLWYLASRTGLTGPGETVETVLTDLLANTMHLCLKLGITTTERDGFRTILEHASIYVDMETGEEC
ncbi:TPA: hypothetical protein RKY22_005646 [Klebsiella michiganensis]|nr:hypothetical protein [Klebsiella michiganensis]